MKDGDGSKEGLLPSLIEKESVFRAQICLAGGYRLYRGKTGFVTGHTGYKDSWMCKVLEMCGAEVVGYAL